MLYILTMNSQQQYIFGNRLQALRKERGLSQTELGERIGLSKRMIIYYEKHSTRIPKLELVQKFATVLNCSIDNFLDHDLKVSTPPQKQKLWKKLKKVENFPEDQQKAVISIIDSIEKTIPKQKI